MRDPLATVRRKGEYGFTTVRACVKIHVLDDREEAGLDRIELGYIRTGIDVQIPLGCQYILIDSIYNVPLVSSKVSERQGYKGSVL
jgi:hypothetical protein